MYTFAEQIDYNLKNRVETKIECLAKACEEFTGKKIDADIERRVNFAEKDLVVA